MKRRTLLYVLLAAVVCVAGLAYSVLSSLRGPWIVNESNDRYAALAQETKNPQYCRKLTGIMDPSLDFRLQGECMYKIASETGNVDDCLEYLNCNERMAFKLNDPTVCASEDCLKPFFNPNETAEVNCNRSKKLTTEDISLCVKFFNNNVSDIRYVFEKCNSTSPPSERGIQCNPFESRNMGYFFSMCGQEKESRNCLWNFVERFKAELQGTSCKGLSVHDQNFLQCVDKYRVGSYAYPQGVCNSFTEEKDITTCLKEFGLDLN